MAYHTTTVNSMTELLEIIKSFVVHHGWTPTTHYTTKTLVEASEETTYVNGAKSTKVLTPHTTVTSTLAFYVSMTPSNQVLPVSTDIAVNVSSVTVNGYYPYVIKTTTTTTTIKYFAGYTITKGEHTIHLAFTDEGIVMGSSRSGVSSPIKAGIYDKSQWPVKAHLFAQTNPEFIACVVGNEEFMWLAFGQTKKYADWQGGEWFAASHHHTGSAFIKGSYSGTNYSGNAQSSDEGWWVVYPTYFITTKMTYAHSPGNPFVQSVYPASDLYCDISGGWGNSSQDGWLKKALHSEITKPLYDYAPNPFNNFTTLIPYWLSVGETRSGGMVHQDAHGIVYDTNKLGIIGELPWFRGLRIDSFKPGEIITRGSDRWIVFPWTRKRAEHFYPPPSTTGMSYGLGGSDPTYEDSAYLGWAIKYDGP